MFFIIEDAAVKYSFLGKRLGGRHAVSKREDNETYTPESFYIQSIGEVIYLSELKSQENTDNDWTITLDSRTLPDRKSVV